MLAFRSMMAVAVAAGALGVSSHAYTQSYGYGAQPFGGQAYGGAGWETPSTGGYGSAQGEAYGPPPPPPPPGYGQAFAPDEEYPGGGANSDGTIGYGPYSSFNDTTPDDPQGYAYAAEKDRRVDDAYAGREYAYARDAYGQGYGRDGGYADDRAARRAERRAQRRADRESYGDEGSTYGAAPASGGYPATAYGQGAYGQGAYGQGAYGQGGYGQGADDSSGYGRSDGYPPAGYGAPPSY